MAKKSKRSEQSIEDARRQLAEAEYMNSFLVTTDVVSAKKAYRKALGDLRANPPESVEKRAIDLRKQMIAILDPQIKKVKRMEWVEFELLHAQVRRLLLKDDVADTGIPDQVMLDHLRDMQPGEVNAAVSAMRQLQEMRRDILLS